MLKLIFIQDPVSNKLICHADSIDRSTDLFKDQNVVASFDVSDLYLHATNL